MPRKFFRRSKEVASPPDLLFLSIESYEAFLQFRKSPLEREHKGLEYVFQTSFPLREASDKIVVEYLGYEVGDWECNKCGYNAANDHEFLAGYGVKCPKCTTPLVYKEKITEEEAKLKGLTYAVPLRVMVRLKAKTKKGERVDEPRKIYFGEVPMMTSSGSFIVNGSEKVIVNQLIRSPGVFFEEKEERQRETTIVKILYRASIIPDKGPRIEFELSSTSDTLVTRIDKKKVGGTFVFRAFGLESAYDILSRFYPQTRKYVVRNGEIFDAESGESFSVEDLSGSYIFAVLRYMAKDERGIEEEYIEERYIEEISHLERLLKDERLQIDSLCALEREVVAKSSWGKIIVETIVSESLPREQDRKSSMKIPSRFSLRDVALVDIYKKARAVEPMVIELQELIKRANEHFRLYFQDLTRYDLSRVGRVKLNARVHKHHNLRELKPADVEILDQFPLLVLSQDYGEYKANTPVNKELLENLFKTNSSVFVRSMTDRQARFLQTIDLVNTVKYLISLRFGREKKDDIAYLGNRRIRAVGELLENQTRIGFAKMERFFKDRCNASNPEDPNLKPQDLLNPRYLTTSLYEFLKSAMLSQYLDSTNPLSSLTHKRRLSALGPGGLTRESAKFEIRDVHPSHYGRICPIETPEGQNIGLVTSLTVFAQTNEYGFIVTPYKRVENGKVTDKVDYLAAYEEEDYIIAQYTPSDDEGKIASDRVFARFKNDILIVKPEQVSYMDVSPKQVISVSASLIPF
ncbi:MAG: DNA-directed RNA polymerase subunit beta, partial [Aquificaceae bacterium]|nr:DNA-directed RNA polymerase subunit beta [Aquificaceae bacterium]